MPLLATTTAFRLADSMRVGHALRAAGEHAMALRKHRRAAVLGVGSRRRAKTVRLAAEGKRRAGTLDPSSRPPGDRRAELIRALLAEAAAPARAGDR